MEKIFSWFYFHQRKDLNVFSSWISFDIRNIRIQNKNNEHCCRERVRTRLVEQIFYNLRLGTPLTALELVIGMFRNQGSSKVSI